LISLRTNETLTVLIAEDYPDFRSRLTRLLEALGLRCLPAFDGQRAIEYLQDLEIEIHLIVTDLDMPRRTGWDVIAAARRLRDVSLPIILQTGEANRLDVQARAKDLGIPLVEKLSVDAFLPGMVATALNSLTLPPDSSTWKGST
jgi:two-component system, chemotaxis family, sensor kinase CheA